MPTSATARGTYIHTYIHAHIHTYIYMHKLKVIIPEINKYDIIHIYIHTYIHTCMHTYIGIVATPGSIPATITVWLTIASYTRKMIAKRIFRFS